jgi:hypothetical protein
MFDKKMSSILYAGVPLVYQLAVVLDVVTESATQGADGSWRQEPRVAYQGVHSLFCSNRRIEELFVILFMCNGMV